MALEDILVAIRGEAETEIGRIGTEAGGEVTAILDGGCAEAKAVEEAAAVSLDDDAAQHRARIVNRAHLVVERRERAAAEDVYVELREEVAFRLARRRDEPGYQDLFLRLFEECRAVLPDARIVRVDPADQDVAGRMVADGAFDGFSIDPSLASIGGLELVTEDGRRCVRNTLEARFERADRPLRSLAATMVPALRGEA